MKEGFNFIEVSPSHIRMDTFYSEGQRWVKSFSHGYQTCFCNKKEFYEDVQKFSGVNKNGKQKNLLVLCGGYVITKQIQIPSHDYNEIEKIASFEVLHQFPYSLDEIVFDHQILEQAKDGFSRVLLILIKKNILSKLLETFLSAGFYIDDISIRGFSCQGYAGHSQKPRLFIFLGNKTAELFFYQENKIFFIRNFHYEFFFEEKKYDSLIRNVQLSLQMYKNNHYGPLADEIFIKFLFPQKEEKAIAQAIGEKVCLQTTVVGQGIFSPCDYICLFKKHRKRKPIEYFVKRYARGAIIFLFVLAFFFSGMIAKIILKNIQVQKNKEELKVLDFYALDAKEIERAFLSLKHEMSNQYSLGRIFEELSDSFNGGIFLQVCDWMGEGKGMLLGWALDRKHFNRFKDQLFQSEYFRNFKIEHVSEKRRLGKNIIDFKILIEIGTNHEH